MVLLLACTEEPISRTIDPATIEALTMEEPGELPGRTNVMQAGVPRTVDGGPGMIEESGFVTGGEYPVVEMGEGVRVLARRDDVRLLLWVDRTDLLPVVAETTWVDRDGHQAGDGEAGVRLTAGLPVEMDDEGAYARLGSVVEGRVAVADGLVDEAWWPDARADADVASDVWLVAGTTFYDADGETLLAFRDEYERGWAVAAAAILDREEGRVFVRARIDTHVCGGGEIDVRAWVDEDAIADDDAARVGRGWCCGCCGFGWGRSRSGQSVDLPAGTLLFDAPDGGAIGIAEADVSLSLAEDAGAMPGWNSVRVATAWGDAVLWATDSDLAWDMRSM